MYGGHTYLSTDAYKHNPKYEKSYERYDFVYEYMKNIIEQNPELSFLDLGCGDASYIYYLKKKHPHIKFTGLEYSEDLLNGIRQEEFLKDAEFFYGDVCTYDFKKQFDVAHMSGVLSIFDDIDTPIQNMCKHIKPGGWGYIFGGVNEHDVDVQVRFKNHYKQSEIWESGLNMYSLSTIRKALEPYAENVDIHKFDLSIDLPKSEDPVRSFTLNTQEMGKIVLNGVNVIRDFRLVVFQKK